MNYIFQQYKNKYTIATTMLTILLLGILWYGSVPILSITVLIAWFLSIGFSFGNFIEIKQFNWRCFWGVLFSINTSIFLLSVGYWFFGFSNELISTVVLLLFASSLFIQQKKSGISRFRLIDLISLFFAASPFLILLFTLYNRRFSDTLLSPWVILGSRFFLLYVIGVGILLLLLWRNKKRTITIPLISIYFVLQFSVGLLIFAHGFGFDPFIHQATEKYIAEHGIITPKQPYYIGQYVLTLLVHTITNLSIDNIDRLWVPIFAGIFLPTSLYFTLYKKSKTTLALAALPLVLLFPFNFFTQTTPNNFALLLAYLGVLWLWYSWNKPNNKTNLIGCSFVLATLSIHAFIGIPLAIVYFFALIYQKKPKWNAQLAPIYLISLSTGLPAALALNSLISSNTLRIVNPLQHINEFLSIFARPFWFWLTDAPLQWQLLYYYHDILKPVLITIMLVTLVYFLLRKYSNKIGFFALSFVGTVISSFLLATAIRFGQVISYEQTVFAERLLEFSLVFLLPFFIFALSALVQKVQRYELRIVRIYESAGAWSEIIRKFVIRMYKYFFIILISCLLLISWYFTYPTRDPVSRYTGYNVRDADIEAVHFIHDRNQKDEIDYIVLANQTVSAAALNEFGFIKYFETKQGQMFYYPIPTGGLLYPSFLHMVYDEPLKVWVEEAMDLAGVDKAYFIHTNYWAPAADLRDAAKLEADNWWELGHGRVWVYEYLR